MKKALSILLTISLMLSLVIAAIPVSAAITLPDGAIIKTKEVTKDVSLSNFKLFAYNHAKAYTDANGAEHAAGWDSLLTNAEYQSMIKTDATRGEYIRNDANLYDNNYYYLIYPLAENQQLKKINYTVKHLTYGTSFFAPMMALNHSGTGKYYLMSYQSGTLTANQHRNVSRRFDTAPNFAGYYSSSPAAVDPSSMLAANAQANAPGFTLTKNDPGSYQFANEANVTVEFSDSSIDFSFVQEAAELSLSYSAVATNIKQYPLLTLFQTYSGTTVRDHWYKNIQITYTESVDMTQEVKDFVEANPLSLEIRKGLTVGNIPSAELDEYATKATDLKDNFADASAELQEVLKEYGYYNESLVDLIVNVKDVAATLPDATITALGDVTKIVSLEDMKVLSATSGLIDSTDNTKLVNIAITDSDEISGGKAVTYADANGTLTTGDMVFYYPLAADETIKSFSYIITYDEYYYPYPAVREGANLYLGRNFFHEHKCGLTDTTGTCAGKQLQAKVNLTSDQIATKVASSDYSIAALGSASSHTCWPGTFTPAKTGTDGNLSTPKNAQLKYTVDYTGEVPTLTVENLSNGDVAVFNYTATTQKHYPMAMAKIQSGFYTHFSDFTITYTAPTDVKSQVAEFVAANPFALDIRNDNIDLTGDLSQYKDSATALTAAYNAADKDLQNTLVQYGYYDEDVINVILGGGDAINEYKTEHSAALGISAIAVKDIAASYDTYKALYDAAVADLSSVESYIELGMGADIEPALNSAKASLADALKYKGYADLIVNGTLKYENDFEGEETLEQVHSLTYPYDENKAAFADNGKVYVNTTNKNYAIPDTLKGFDINTSSNAFGLENRFYYKVYGRDDLRFANQYSANEYLWDAAKENGLSLDRVTGIFNVGGNAASWVYAPAIIYSYTDANHYSLISINGIGPSGTTTLNNAGMSAGNFKVEEYTYDADNTEKPLTLVKAYPTITIGRVAETDDETTDGWIKFSFAYNEDGTAQFTFINGGHIYSLSTQNTTSAENKFFAMAKLTGVNLQNLANPIYYGGRLYVDNLEITFEEDENLAYYAKANDYRVEWEEIFLRNPDFVAPYDVAEITAAKAAYDNLDDKVKAHLTNEGVTAKLTALVNAAAKWDITDDASIVASYKTNFATTNASNYKIAYNVYNRLTAAQKAELKSEYEAMLALFAAEEQVANTTDIVVMGDSNTAGYGVVSNNDTSKRWTALLGNKLGSDYTVSNGGISGYRLVNDTTNIEGLQFRDAGSVLWTQSHTMGFDMVVVALGTNDASLINNEAKAEKWEALYEEFVQSYLALENSPTLVLANFGRTKNLTSTERDTGYESVNAVIKNVADKYGITLIDIDAMYDVSLNLFQSDNLHWNEAGHEWMAGHYEKAITEITANAYSLADQKVFYDYSSDDITASVNGFAPEIVSATIKNSTVNQDMRFMVTVSKNVPAGKEIAEYGMVLADYRNITNGTLSFKDMTCDSDSKYLIIGKSSSASNDNLGMTYYVNVGGIDASKYGAPIIARAYVKCTDGTVYYSLNTTEGGDYAARKGVKDGYIVRSIISITKAMLIHLNKNSVDVSSVVKIENDAIVAYISANGTEANVPDDATRLFKIIKENVAILERQ